MKKELSISLNRDEAQVIANCVTVNLQNDNVGGNFPKRFEIYQKLMAVLDDFTAMEYDEYGNECN